MLVLDVRMAIAALGLAMGRGFDDELTMRLRVATLPAHAVSQLVADKARLGAIVPPPGLDPAQRAQVRDAVRHAFVAGFRQVMWWSAGLVLASAACAWLTIGRSGKQQK